ncbi:MAG: GntR family transcriptional regulator [Victivallales bacterium]|nr:GntR family transcriptional regulator [Victivallales bacterium]
MKLVTAPSKTSQIADYLRAGIRKGTIAPGSRMSSIRELSDRFGASKRIIGCALELLEKERLIRREHGRGVFVETPSAEDCIEVYMLLWNTREETNNYIDEVIKMTYPPILPVGFNFTVRTTVAKPGDFSGLDGELSRIKNTAGIQCVMAGTQLFGQEQIEKLKTLPCPVIFFGDSALGSLDNVHFNQITGDNKLVGRMCAEYLHRDGQREITLFTLSRNCYFYKLFCEGVEEVCHEHNIDLALYELPEGVHNLEKSTCAEVYRDMVDAAVTAGHLSRPLISNAMKFDSFLPELNRFFRLESSIPLIRAQFSADRYGCFFDAAFDAIHTLVVDKQETGKRRINADFIIEDVARKQKILVSDSNFKVLHG